VQLAEGLRATIDYFEARLGGQTALAKTA